MVVVVQAMILFKNTAPLTGTLVLFVVHNAVSGSCMVASLELKTNIIFIIRTPTFEYPREGCSGRNVCYLHSVAYVDMRIVLIVLTADGTLDIRAAVGIYGAAVDTDGVVNIAVLAGLA